MKINWKKIMIAVGLGMGLLGCTGCKEKTVEEKENQDTLTICTQPIYVDSMTKLIETWEYFNKPLKAELIVIPDSPDEAEIKISEIRTEMLAGGGPDVFLVRDNRCFNVSKWGEEVQPMLFQNPEKAMYTGTFLPLDDYIKNAKHFNPEHYNPVIMEAGKTEEGQCLLPVAYDYRVSYFEEPQENPIQMPLPSWDSLVSGEAGLTSTMFPAINHSFPDHLGEYADYENEKLLLSKEELYQCVLDSIDFGIFAENGPEVKGLNLVWAEGDLASSFVRNSTGYKQNPNSLLANPNREGGINANITTWAGINKNTKRPSQAFSFLDLLFSDEIMTREGFSEAGKYAGSSTASYFFGVPSHQEAFENDCKYLPDDTEKAFKALNSQINSVRFSSDLDKELQKMRDACREAKGNEEEQREIVKEACEKIELMLAE